MTVFLSAAALLERPFHERQNLVVIADPDEQDQGGLSSGAPGQSAGLDPNSDQLGRIVQGGLAQVGASHIGRAAIGRAREVARAGAGGGLPAAALPVAAIAAVSVGALTLFFNGRNGIPDNVTCVSASAAEGLTFTEGPFELGCVYSAHPKQEGRYLPWNTFQQIILAERIREVERFFITCCGASRVETHVEQTNDFSTDLRFNGLKLAGSASWDSQVIKSTKDHRIIEAPGRMAPNDLLPDEWTWLDAQQVWQDVHDMRRNAGVTRYERETTITDRRTLDVKALSKVPGYNGSLDGGGKRHTETLLKWDVLFPAA